MKRTNLLADVSCRDRESIISSRLIEMPLSQQDIIELHDSLLTPGFHYIRVKDIRNGREIISDMVKSLGCYNKVAYMTLERCSFNEPFFNLYQELNQLGIIKDTNGGMEDYLLSDFFADLLCIEATSNLLMHKIFLKFEQLLVDFSFINALPIIVLFYQEE